MLRTFRIDTFAHLMLTTRLRGRLEIPHMTKSCKGLNGLCKNIVSNQAGIVAKVFCPERLCSFDDATEEISEMLLPLGVLEHLIPLLSF